MAELKEARQSKRTATTQVTALRGQLDEMQAAIAGMPQQRVELIQQAVAQMHANYAQGIEQGAAQVAAKAQELAEMNARVTRLAREVSFLQGGPNA
jgi:cell division protein FtsB